MRRTFTSSDGESVGDPGEDHVDIARRILPAVHGITPVDFDDCYTQMFRLGYARIAEDARTFQIERAAGLSEAQRAAMEGAALAGKEVRLNNRPFVESKTVH